MVLHAHTADRLRGSAGLRKRGSTEMDMGIEIYKAALIDIDASFFLQITIFLGLYLGLWAAFFRPYVKMVEARDQATEERRRLAAELTEKARRLEREIDARLHDAKAQALKTRRALADEGSRLRAEIIARERTRMHQMLEQYIGGLEQEKSRIRHDMDRIAQGLADILEEQVLSAER